MIEIGIKAMCRHQCPVDFPQHDRPNLADIVDLADITTLWIGNSGCAKGVWIKIARGRVGKAPDACTAGILS